MKPTVESVTEIIEHFAHPGLAAPYDNVGLLTGNKEQNCTGVLCCLDITLEVLEEALAKNCNLIVAHHPIIFQPLKKLSGNDHVSACIRFAIKHDLAIYACHTNLDHIYHGVNNRIAEQLGLINESLSIIDPQTGLLSKMVVYVPQSHCEAVREALFAGGAGNIGNYTECSFESKGVGSFKPAAGTNPFIGKAGGQREYVEESRLELIVENHNINQAMKRLREAHPYEEIAYEIIPVSNTYQAIGSGIMGRLPEPIDENSFLRLLCKQFKTNAVRHTHFTGKPIANVAVCGGAGSFLIEKAMAKGADAFVTADLKYHDYFRANGQIMLADIGHFESEQFTIDLMKEHLLGKLPNFAILSTEVSTNPTKVFVA